MAKLVQCLLQQPICSLSLSLGRRFPRYLSSTTGIEAEKMAERIISLQALYEQTIPAEQPYVLRLDGVAFKTFTAGMVKPFDRRLTRAMLLTTRDLMERCAARTAYCQSDEISLLFAPEPVVEQIMYAGRVQKLVSVMASCAAARFNYHLARMEWTDVEKPVQQRVLSQTALFDARVFSCPDDIMASEGIRASP